MNWSTEIYNLCYEEVASRKKWQNRDFDIQFDHEVGTLFALFTNN